MRIAKLLSLILALALFAVPGLAGQGGTSITTTAASITTASGNCLAADGNRRSLALDATAAAANVAYCMTTPGASACTAAIGTAGTTTIGYGVGAILFWPSGDAPQNQFCFIAASTQPLTIRQGY